MKRRQGGEGRGGGRGGEGRRGGDARRGGKREERWRQLSDGRGGSRRPRAQEPARPAPEQRAPREVGPRPSGVAASERFVFGINPVLELLRGASNRIDRLLIVEGAVNPRVAGELLSRARDANVRYEYVPKDRLERLGEGLVHQGVVAEVRQFDFVELSTLIHRAKTSGRPMLIVVLDGIEDPHNFGAIVRSAVAFGAQGLVIGKDRSAPVTGVVAKASAGAIAHATIARVTNISRALEELKAAGVWVVAADPSGDRSLWHAPLDGHLALVVGAEGEGVREGVLKHCDFRVQIPMTGTIASLNASVSAGVLLAEISRQRAMRPSSPGATVSGDA